MTSCLGSVDQTQAKTEETVAGSPTFSVQNGSKFGH